MKLHYLVSYSGEPSAGLVPYTEDVQICVGSGDPGGENGEFAQFMQESLQEWFDGASVELVQDV